MVTTSVAVLFMRTDGGDEQLEAQERDPCGAASCCSPLGEGISRARAPRGPSRVCALREGQSVLGCTPSFSLMPLAPGYGETPLDPEEADALTAQARALLGDDPTKADLY